MLALMLLVSSSVFAANDPIDASFKSMGCFNCHAIDHKVVGPAFKDVSTKYKGVAFAEDKLVIKVSQGGKGVWGTASMIANDPNKIKQTEIHRLVQYILKL